MLASNEISNLLPIYSHNNVYISHYAHLHYLVSNAEAQQRWLVAWQLYGLPAEQVEPHIRAHSRDLFGLYYRELTGAYIVPLAEERRLMQEYAALAGVDIPALLRVYRLDYILYSPYEQRTFGTDPLSLSEHLIKVYDQDGIQVFRIEVKVARGAAFPGCWQARKPAPRVTFALMRSFR